MRPFALPFFALGLAVVLGAAARVVGPPGGAAPPWDGVGLGELARTLEACRAGAPPRGRGPARGRGGEPRTGAGPGSPCTRLVYVWSPSMPLSELGIREARRAAREAGVALSVVPAVEVVEARSDLGAEDLRTRLVAAGVTVHYPALALVVEGEVRGTALLGYKRAEAYRDLILARLGRIGDGADPPAPVGPPPRLPGLRTPTGGSAGTGEVRDVQVLWTHTVQPPPGAFFRRVPGTSLITFDQRGAVHLRDLTTGEQFRGPGWIDFVPTPDGRLFVTPGRANSGLEFYSARDVVERGRDGTAAELDPIVVDERMADQYPSVGILQEDADGGWTRYRILVSWFAGLAFRDYEVRWTRNGAPREVEALTEKLTGCPGRDLSTPILSKDGREVAARDEDGGTTRIFRLEDDGRCREILDLGRQTSKVGFSDDGTLVAYSSPDGSSRGRGTRSTTYVLHRVDMRTTTIPHSASAGLVIPEVVGRDSLLIAVKEEARSRTAEFRLLCCVR